MKIGPDRQQQWVDKETNRNKCENKCPGTCKRMMSR